MWLYYLSFQTDLEGWDVSACRHFGELCGVKKPLSSTKTSSQESISGFASSNSDYQQQLNEKDWMVNESQLTEHI